MSDEVMRRRADRFRRLLGDVEAGHLPGWLRPTAGESRWPAGLAVLLVIALQLAVSRELAFSPKWLLPAIELALFVTLIIANPFRVDRESMFLRVVAIGLVAVASLAVQWSVARLVYLLVDGHFDNAPRLLVNGGAIWATNVMVFALWYWEVDRGGPASRAAARDDTPDFLFAPMTAPEMVPRDWEPRFADYLYLSFTNSTAFSPTDTLPLSRWAKLTMMAQATVSFVTVVLVVARAVNILR